MLFSETEKGYCEKSDIHIEERRHRQYLLKIPGAWGILVCADANAIYIEQRGKTLIVPRKAFFKLLALLEYVYTAEDAAVSAHIFLNAPRPKKSKK